MRRDRCQCGDSKDKRAKQCRSCRDRIGKKKRCTRCKQLKRLNQFRLRIRKTVPPRPRPKCRKCESSITNDPSRREIRKEIKRRHIKKDPADYHARQRKNLILRRFGNRVGQVILRSLKTQKFCLLCDKERKLVPDHCHVSGKFRGLICEHCNLALGLFCDNPRTLQRAIEYLKSD